MGVQISTAIVAALGLPLPLPDAPMTLDVLPNQALFGFLSGASHTASGVDVPRVTAWV